jgi:PPOX class probable F420-dependent enzyme
MSVLSRRERAFLLRRRVGRLATADAAAVPHIVPVCFALGDDVLYTAIDEKPKRGVELRRLRNIAENPAVTFLVDHYDEDWSRLGWLRLDGRGEILREGDEFDSAVRALRDRYVQYATMKLSPLIVLPITRAHCWGNLHA